MNKSILSPFTIPENPEGFMSQAEQGHQPVAPTRKLTSGFPHPDELGFLDIGRNASAITIREALASQAIAIVALPWMGKSTFARDTIHWLESKPDGLPIFGEFLALTKLESTYSPATILPPWWETWKRSTPGNPACWVVDALDEGEHRFPGVRNFIIDAILDIPAEKRSSDLRFVSLMRPRDWQSEFEQSLKTIYDDPGSGVFRSFQLAQLDRQEAEKFLGTQEDFARVDHLIRNGRLESIAGYPKVLAYLKNFRGDEKLDATKVWRFILEDLVSDRNSYRTIRPQTPIEDRFDAAARIGATLTLVDREAFSIDARIRHIPAISDIIPVTTAGAPHAHNLRKASEEVVVLVCYATVEGGYRFCQKNVRDWFAAFGLKRMKLDQLRSLFSSRGEIIPGQQDILRLLALVTEKEDVRRWIEEALAKQLPLTTEPPWDLDESLRRVTALEELAARTGQDLGIYGEDGLSKLFFTGLGRCLAERLADNNRPPAVRRLLMDIAFTIGATEISRPAIDIALDESQEVQLREWALIVVRRLGDREDASRLEALGRHRIGLNDEFRSLIAQAILVLLEKGVWGIQEASRNAPCPNRAIGDSTFSLWYEIGNRLTIDDARSLIQAVLQVRSRRPKRTGGTRKLPRRLRKLLVVCAEKLLSEPDLSRTDRVVLVRILRAGARSIRHPRIVESIVNRLAQEAAGRRLLYRQYIRSMDDRTLRWAIRFRFILSPDDLGWLISRASSKWSDREKVWEDLYILGIKATNRGATDRSTWTRVTQVIERHAPDLPGRMESARLQAEEQERQWKEQRRARAQLEVRRFPIVEIVDTVLGRSDWSPEDRMKELSLLCLCSNDWCHYSNVDGTWMDLDRDRQSRVLADCRIGLERCSPTPFPGHRSSNSHNVAEARAFATLANDPANLGWLGDPLISSWLPVVLRTSVTNAQGTIKACALANRSSTISALLNAVEIDIESGDSHSFIAEQIPVDLWQGEVASQFSEFIRNTSLRDETRANLLEILAGKDPSSLLPLVIDLAGSVGLATTLGLKSLDLWLPLDPDGAISIVEGALLDSRPDILRGLTSLWQGRMNLKLDLENSPTSILVRLARIILQIFPLSISAYGRPWVATSVTTDHELRRVRDRVVHILIGRQLAGERPMLEPLMEIDPDLRDHYELMRGRREAGEILRDSVPSSQREEMATEDHSIPIESVIRLLDEADYRFVRSDDDLLNAIIELIEKIDSDKGHDLALLYGSPVEESDPGNIAGEGEERKHATVDTRKAKSRKPRKLARKRLGEDALQAYIRRRLLDLLPPRIPGIKEGVYREDQISYRRRLDLRIVCPTIQGDLATVLVEIKWSDNPETATSLIEQLARKYMHSESKTCGIYLVGWMGSWKNGSLTTSDKASLKSHLDSQCAQLKDQGWGKAMRIVPIVLDLEWRESHENSDEAPPNQQSQ